MRVNGLFVESVDLRRDRGFARGSDVLGYGIDRCLLTPGEKDPGPLMGKGACDGTTDATGRSVDHRNPVLQHRHWLLSAVGDRDTAVSADWAPANRPVRWPAGVYT